MNLNDINALDNFDDLLSRYLKGHLNEAQEAQFNEMIAQNPDIKNKAIATARLAKAMQKVGEERDSEIIEELESLDASQARGVATSVTGKGIHKTVLINTKRFVWSISAAASILLCVFGGYKYYKYEQVTSLGAEYLAYFPASEYSRGEDSNVNETLQPLYADIQDKRNLPETIERLTEMWTESRGDTYNNYTEYMPEIGWMLANAYLRDNEKETALEVLDILIADSPEGMALGDKARELKTKIESL